MASEQQPGFLPTALISPGPSSSVTRTLLWDAPQATRALAPLTEVFPLPLRLKGVLTHTGTAKVIGIRELGAFLFEEGGVTASTCRQLETGALVESPFSKCSKNGSSTSFQAKIRHKKLFLAEVGFWACAIGFANLCPPFPAAPL